MPAVHTRSAIPIKPTPQATPPLLKGDMQRLFGGLATCRKEGIDPILGYVPRVSE
jgi:hypothetical protein